MLSKKETKIIFHVTLTFYFHLKSPKQINSMMSKKRLINKPILFHIQMYFFLFVCMKLRPKILSSNKTIQVPDNI